MPKGPKGEKRPADVIGGAVHVMRIATGEITEISPHEGKDPAAVALGQCGGKARAASTSKVPCFTRLAAHESSSKGEVN
jgi:hypothetical protein